MNTKKKCGEGNAKAAFHRRTFLPATVLFSICALSGLMIPTYAQEGGTFDAARNLASAVPNQPDNDKSFRTQGGSMTMKYFSVNASQFPVIVSQVIVWDQNNVPVGGLTKDNFVVHEDSVFESPIKVESFGGDSGGVSVVLVMDISGSMEDELPDAKVAAITFVSLLSEFDQAALVSFDETVRIEHGFTQDWNALIDAINALDNGSGTAVFDGTMQALDMLATVEGRRAVVLLTDGRDHSSSTPLDELLARLSTKEIPVHSIGLGLKPGSGVDDLRAIAETSGGLFYETPSSSELEDIYRTLAFILSRYWYRITYTTHNPTTDGTLRHVRIKANDQGLSTFDNNTYRAPDHVPTVAPAAQSVPNPGREFVLDVEIPAGSKYMYNLYDLRVVIRYDKQYLRVKDPLTEGIIPASFFGQSSEYTFAMSADTAKGKIAFRFQRDPNLPPAEGRGLLAQIRFVTNTALPDNTPLSFRIVSLSAADRTGWPVAVQSSDLTVNSYGLVVWPGDTNHNGTVELTDVLVLGVNWEITGPPRTGPGDQNAWMPRLAGRFANPEVAHADANGSGMVEERDIIPIGLNWRRTRYEAAATKVSTVTPIAPDGEIALELRTAARAGEYRLAVNFRNHNNAELAGLAFRLEYPADEIRIASAKAGEAWASSPLAITRDNPATRTFAVGMMIPAGSPTGASDGHLVEFRIESTQRPEVDEFRLHDLVLVSPTGEMRELNATRVSEPELHSAPQKFSFHPAYPNPFQSDAAGRIARGTALRYDLPEDASVEVSVFNSIGQRVKTMLSAPLRQGRHTLRWNGLDDQQRRLPSGLYLIQVEGRGGSGAVFRAIRRVMLIR